MSGAGTFGAGLEPAGLDPVGAFSPKPSLGTQPRALLFNITTRQHVINADGTMASVHPVDQRVTLALGVKLGSIPSAPGVGNKLRTITRGSLAQLTAQANDYVEQALIAMTTAKEISVISIGVFAPQPGQLIVQVTYTNLITSQKMTAAASLF